MIEEEIYGNESSCVIMDLVKIVAETRLIVAILSMRTSVYVSKDWRMCGRHTWDAESQVGYIEWDIPSGIIQDPG